MDVVCGKCNHRPHRQRYDRTRGQYVTTCAVVGCDCTSYAPRVVSENLSAYASAIRNQSTLNRFPRALP